MSDLTVLESPREQASNEVLAWVFDFTNRLVSAQTVSSATATMTQLDTGTDVSATTITGGGNPSVASPNVTVTVRALTARKKYRLTVAAVLSGGSTQDADLELETPH